ncbi:uncharacterized protein C12orf40 homolog [Orycteropus afer afer]|uniref:Uncharacterized protein C12orf40 homolog n=1 Tax=Orycteropus afer afer TaxID=1230840 RepID=A0A8B7A099_ORYAF|nr:uncharacterized protein C12orf40 homolog [Orycteropus afer afer]
MNWVGGARTRVLIKQEKRKQKEYFEKKKLKSKMELLEVLSPAKNSTVSLDLLNLYIVNQISCKKKTSETVRKPIHVNMNRDIKMPLRKHDVELTMSPNCVPSKLCIDDTDDNNIHYQRLGSKEELGSVQSQVMDSCSVFEPRVNRTENYRFSSPSFSAKLSSNSYIPKQNFAPQIIPSPWKITYERKQNEQNIIDSIVIENSFKHFMVVGNKCNSFPGNGNPLTERPAIIMSEDCGSMNERRESDFITEKQIVQPLWGESRRAILNCFEDVNQPIPNILSENCDSLIGQNMINLLNFDQQRIKENNDEYSFDTMGNICAITSSNKNCSTDRCIRSIFTVPELTFINSALNKTNFPEKFQPKKNYKKEYNNNERNNFSTSSEKYCYLASSEKTGKYENSYQEKIPLKKMQKYPVNNMGNIPLEELQCEQSWDIGFGEVLMEERGTCSLKDRPTSTKKIYFDSSQSTQSTYSPRQTDSCFSSSSEMPSEDEDQVLQQHEESKRRFIKTKERNNNVYINRMSRLPDDKIVKNTAKIHKQNENSHQFLMKNNRIQFPQSQCNSAYIFQNKTNSNYLLQFAKCDAWVQTESEYALEEKLDAAIQCEIISKCKCRSDMSSLCSVESCSKNIKADTTGGQDILENN